MPKNLFEGEPGYQHGEIPAVGVLLAFLGTPEAPTAAALRPYLRQFLSDPRVIEMSRPAWWLILNLFVLPFRPRKSAQLYAKIWTDEGSPLLVISRRQAAAIEKRLKSEIGTPVHVALGATYGRPSMRQALESLRARGCRRLLFFPLFAHYSSTSTGAAFDALTAVLGRWRWLPELRTIFSYHDEPAYVRALAAGIRRRWRAEGEPEKLVMSFHGIPQRYLENGDPYHCQCLKTGRLLADELGLAEDRWLVTFQSLFGREEWIKPYTDVTLQALARAGVKHVDVVCPGFAADCLETLEEIEEQNREFFLAAGGETFRYLPALNDRPDHIDLLVDLIRRNLHGWVVPKEDWDAAAVQAEAEAVRRRAEARMRSPARADGGGGG
ncbi:MAG: ferrochelatase [Acidobacteria bacterium]|nr:MAG: ferrochelatase [Acidobacteriota bacterium]